MAVNTIKMKRAALRAENLRWSDEMVEVIPKAWHESFYADPRSIRLWRSRRLLAQVFQEANGVIRISFNRTDIDDFGKWKQDISWDELQKAKSEMGFGDKFAVEVFPADKDIVNVANMRHLWVLQEPLAFGWVKKEPRE